MSDFNWCIPHKAVTFWSVMRDLALIGAAIVTTIGISGLLRVLSGKEQAGASGATQTTRMPYPNQAQEPTSQRQSS
jgi:hypothetical protein